MMTFGRQGSSNPKSFKMNSNKRSLIQNKPINVDEGGRKSLDLAQMLQHQKSLVQSYREKNQRNVQKCRFLYNKLIALGSLQGIPEMISTQVSEVDIRIKQLEQQLIFKKTQQMIKLKKKVTTFLQMINFEVVPEDMDKIEDQIEIILFLIDIFEEKFNEMTAQRKEIDQILARIEENNSVKLNTDIEMGSKKESEFLQKISLLEAEIQKLKNEDLKKLEMNLMRKEQPNQIDQLVMSKNQEIEKLKKKNKDLEQEVAQIKKKLQILEVSLERSKRDEARWKERYREMEIKKNQRLKLLEESVNKNS